MEPCGLSTFNSPLSEDHFLPLSEEVNDTELWVLLGRDRPHLTPPLTPGKMAVHLIINCLESYVPVQSQKRCLHYFYILLRQSLRIIEEVKQAFYHQYTFQHELKKNSNHLPTIKMKHGESLKQYVIYFQSQVALVYNCNDDVVVAVFISGLHFLQASGEHEVTKMKDIPTHAQKYIQIENATWIFANHYPKWEEEVKKQKP